MATSTEMVAYVNGKIVPESEVKIPFSDMGVRRGDAVFDSWRTFSGRHFMMREHIDRLYRSCRYTRIDPGLTKEQMMEAVDEVWAVNRPLMGSNDDYNFVVWVSSGPDPVVAKGMVIITGKIIPFASFARHYVHGIRLITPPTRRISAQAVDPRAKTNTYLNHHIALREAKALDQGCWGPLMLDADGYITETSHSNFLFVSNDRINVPNTKRYLPGITMYRMIELAEKMGICAEESDYLLYDVYASDEAFVTVSSFVILPVVNVNGLPVGEGKPGPVYRKLIRAWTDMVGLDCVDQALSHLPTEEMETLKRDWLTSGVAS